MQPLMRRLGRLLPACAALIAASAIQPAMAQLSSAQQSALRSNCRSDFMSHCSGVTPGGKEALVCLQKNVASLSPGCHAAVSATMPPPAPAAAAAPPKAPPPAAATAAPPPPKAAAAPPPPQPSPTVHAAPKPPRPAAKQVMTPPPAPPLPPAPAAGPTPQQLSALKFTCRRDFRVHCRGVAPGPDAFRCLASHEARLTPNCRTSVRAIEENGAMPAATAAPMPMAPPPPPERATVVDAAVMLRACKRDLIRHCRGIEPGGGRMLACLVGHGDLLSVRCRMALKVTSPLR